MNEFSLTFRDEAHLLAHVDHFLVPLDRALGWARDHLATTPRQGWVHADVRCPEPVGLSGLADLTTGVAGSFWGRRRGRSLPSHLIVGEKTPTEWLCVWGFWQDQDTFVLHTLYPGRKAPREIHDPELPLKDLPEALAFWTTHAIVVAPGDWDE